MLETPGCTICLGSPVRPFPAAAWHLNLLPPLGVVRCGSCGLPFLCPRPGPELRRALLSGVVPESLAPYARKVMDYAAVADTRAVEYDRRLSHLERLRAEGDSRTRPRLLDVGAAGGMLVRMARDRGWQAEGLEPSREGSRAGLERAIVLPRGTAEALPFRDEVFDVVHAHHVYEHLPDPLLAAREAWRVLRPGGLLYVEVPNQLDNVMFLRDRLLGRLRQRARDLRSIHHLWFFTRRSLPLLLQKAGFRRVAREEDYAWPPRGWRAPFTVATRLAGRLLGGGYFLRVWGWKPGKQ